MSQSLPAPCPSPWLPSYAALVIVAGLGALAQALWQLPATPQPLGWVTFGALALIASRFSLKLPGVSANLSISDTFFFTSAMLYGPAPATVTIALDSLLMSLRRNHRPLQLAFNPTSNALALWSAAQAFYLLAPPLARTDALLTPPALLVLPLLCMAAIYFALNSSLTCVAVALTLRLPAVSLWRRHFASISVSHIGAASASFALLVLTREAGVLGTVAVAPLIYITYKASRSNVDRLEDAEKHIARINKLYLSTVGAFATAIEAKDGVTSSHIHRVRAYSMELARSLGIQDALTLQALEAASLLHDTGKLAVPEHILNKPGKLSAHERDAMEMHVDVGAGILSSIDFPYPVVPIVAAHHENWDGTGYPKGLRGEAIPIGARILSVVDCYDALTSDRPYRRAMSDDAALRILTDRSGSMYDPSIVEAFLKMNRAIATPEPAHAEMQQALRRIGRPHAGVESDPAADFSGDVDDAARPSSETDPVAEDLRALISLARTTSETPRVPDVARLACSALRAIVPDGTMTLFTLGAAQGVLVPSFVSGAGEVLRSDLTIRVGDRLSGWVAANGHPMVNAQAELDCADLAALGLGYATCLPLLVSSGDVLGVLTVYTDAALCDEKVQRLRAATPELADAIRIAATHTATARGTVGDAQAARANLPVAIGAC